MPSSRTRSVPGTGRDEVVVEALVPGRGGEVVGVGGEFVLRLAAHAVLLGQPFGGLAQGDGPVLGHGLVHQAPAQRRGGQGQVSCRVGLLGLGQYPRGTGHGLGAADQHELGVAGVDLAGGDDRRVQGGAAQPVDRGAGDRDRQPGQQGAHPGDVAVFLAGAVGVAEDHLVDPLDVEGRGALDDLTDHVRGEVIRADPGEAGAELPERGPDGVVHISLVHGFLSISASSMAASSMEWKTCWAVLKAVLAEGTPQ